MILGTPPSIPAFAGRLLRLRVISPQDGLFFLKVLVEQLDNDDDSKDGEEGDNDEEAEPLWVELALLVRSRRQSEPAAEGICSWELHPYIQT